LLSKLYLALIAFSVIVAGSIMAFHQPATSEPQTEQLLSESVALTDQLQTQQRLSVMLSESVALDDKVTGTTGQTGK